MSSAEEVLEKFCQEAGSSLAQSFGRVARVIGLVMESIGPSASVGELCEIILQSGERRPAEVVGFRDGRLLLMPIGEIHGISPGCPVYATGEPLRVSVGAGLLGRVVDGFGRPLDGKGPIGSLETTCPIHCDPPSPLMRKVIDEPLETGIRVLDGLLTIGKGQRIGIFSGSGVGKSTLLGMLARHARASINVIALIGERGREVREFIDRDLGPEGLAKSVLVVATSDRPPLVRMRAAYVATTIAEYFRDQGNDVMLLMDSVTRFARAQREVGLAVGEPPATRGYPPSVFEMLPKFLERSGTSDTGTITGLYTILVEADDMNEPIADTVRGILDGHVVLSRDIAARNRYPAVDVLNSVSRVMPTIVPAEQKALANRIRQVLAVFKDSEDLINIGAYVPGSSRDIDAAIKYNPAILEFLRQETDERMPLEQIRAAMKSIFADAPAQQKQKR